MPLVFVPTPLGNLRDITLHALDVLERAELVVAEDTRVARKLLNALEIGAKRVISYREQNAARVTARILAQAASELVVVVTDAGMPSVSDPGSALVTAARATGVPVEVLPGPSAVLGAAVLSGFPLHRFAFEGFPPRKSGARRRTFDESLRRDLTSVWFESPHRIRACLTDLAAVAPDARVFLVREYTKRYEQQLSGDPASVAQALDDPVRGEITFVIAPLEKSARRSAEKRP